MANFTESAYVPDELLKIQFQLGLRPDLIGMVVLGVVDPVRHRPVDQFTDSFFPQDGFQCLDVPVLRVQPGGVGTWGENCRHSVVKRLYRLAGDSRDDGTGQAC